MIDEGDVMLGAGIGKAALAPMMPLFPAALRGAMLQQYVDVMDKCRAALERTPAELCSPLIEIHHYAQSKALELVRIKDGGK